MADLQSLLETLTTVEAQQDFDAIRRIRERLVLEHPETDSAVEALYKIGLDLLFRERNLEAAVEKFLEAAQCKQPFWSAAARTSLGLCYYHQRHRQKALFELRKVGYAKVPTMHSVTALAFLENIFATEGQPQEAARIRRDRIAQLTQLIETSRQTQGDPGHRGSYLYQLGLALQDQQEWERAEAALKEAQALGPNVLGEDLYTSVLEALPQDGL